MNSTRLGLVTRAHVWFRHQRNAGTDAFADSLAHRLMRKVAQLRKEGTFPWLRPDAKAGAVECR